MERDIELSESKKEYFLMKIANEFSFEQVMKEEVKRRGVFKCEKPKEESVKLFRGLRLEMYRRETEDLPLYGLNMAYLEKYGPILEE